MAGYHRRTRKRPRVRSYLCDRFNLYGPQPVEPLPRMSESSTGRFGHPEGFPSSNIPVLVAKVPVMSGIVSRWHRMVFPAMLLAASALAIFPGGCSEGSSDQQGGSSGRVPDGYVELHEFQVAFIGSGGGGNGTLTFRGKTYPIRFGGLGIGGFGISSVDATGEVFDLHDIKQFPGSYGRARYGFAVGTASAGQMWLQNGSGVVLHLHAKRKGLMLSLGGDALVISMK
ncbi:hypothetical protein [Nguyenibacter vanlangensis]|uniref:DUF1134 domain-containing protein n=2 Tax=Nguyenibacter TaxID=1519186 RepID=A0A7Y7M6U9_9PROT|nr:hypothetical protein [Nguyenibacter vanlangensis]NVN11141.1 hypothetical protein [Nguyenibacter vanlangensis]